jgi:hypothetical protein
MKEKKEECLFHSSFFSSSRLSPTATALSFCLDLRDEWTSGLLFSAALSFSRFTRTDFCSFIRRTACWIFRKERLAQNDNWKIEIGSCKI